MARLGDGSLSRATLLHELASSAELDRVRQLDDAVALGLAARARGERLRWLSGPPATDERVVEIPWVLSRLHSGSRARGRVRQRRERLPRGARAGAARAARRGRSRRAGRSPGIESVTADVRSLPFADGDVRPGAPRLDARACRRGQHDLRPGRARTIRTARDAALSELRRVLKPDGRLLVTVPLGEPGDHGWFRQDDVRGWTRLFTAAGFFVEEQEPYELGEDGWRAAPAFVADGVRYGERGPAASGVLCTELSPGRARRLLTPDGIAAHGQAPRARASPFPVTELVSSRRGVRANRRAGGSP